jgi:SsrA-binding protein
MSVGKVISQNKKARHDYFIEETFEAGMVLTGTEVKSIRAGKVTVNDSYCDLKTGEAFILNMHISPYEMGNIQNVDPMRKRKLLMHKREINKLLGYTAQQGYTLIPLKIYLNDQGYVKLELGVAKGKKLYDKRETSAKRDAERHIQTELKNRQRF